MVVSLDSLRQRQHGSGAHDGIFALKSSRTLKEILRLHATSCQKTGKSPQMSLIVDRREMGNAMARGRLLTGSKI